MSLRMWMLDLAREQSAHPALLHRICRNALEHGYNALGLYLEHRFAYPSVPWSRGVGILTPEMVKELEREYPDLQFVPFINLLAHVEGFLYTENAKSFAEERFKGLSACPSNPEFAKFGNLLLEDTLRCFSSPLIHIGGDETAALGACPACKARVEAASGDGKAQLYAEHFTPLIAKVTQNGRRAAIWGDMLLEHPEAMNAIPKDTLIFDWQYFDSFGQTVPRFANAGFEVVLSPTVHMYNSTWVNLEQAEANLHDTKQNLDKSSGFCVTTWEAGLFGNYETVLPLLNWAGDFLTGDAGPTFSASEWEQLMGRDLVALGGMFTATRIRSSLKVRLLLMANPFLAWMHHAEELCGPTGDAAYRIGEIAQTIATDSSQRGVSTFLLKGIDFVRQAEKCRLAYAEMKPGQALAALSPSRQIFDELEKVAIASNLNQGGSLADVSRCRIAKKHVETVMQRIHEFGDGSLGYLPSFETITHPRFCPHDQAAWWLINRWAHE
jgi:hypothetical protein